MTLQGEIKVDYIDTIEEAIARKLPVCAHSALEKELRRAYKDAHWVFHYNSTAQLIGMLENYDKKNCVALVYGVEDAMQSPKYMEELCKRDLVRTHSIVLEKVFYAVLLFAVYFD